MMLDSDVFSLAKASIYFAKVCTDGATQVAVCDVESRGVSRDKPMHANVIFATDSVLWKSKRVFAAIVSAALRVAP